MGKPGTRREARSSGWCGPVAGRTGEPRQNMNVALSMMDDAAARGVELLVLPELWSCGYDPETLARDARADAEPLDGPRSAPLGEAALRRDMWLAAGSVPELGEDGRIYDTALVFNPHGELVAWHRKAHLYPPTLEPSVFTPGDRLTTFDDPALGRVGLVVNFDGDFPEVARTLALRGARLVLAPAAYEVEGANAWDLLYPAIALTNSQWWVQANQAGLALHLDAARRQPDCGADRHRGGGGEPGRAGLAQPGRAAGAPHRPAHRLRAGRDLRAARGRASSRPLLRPGAGRVGLTRRVAVGSVPIALSRSAVRRGPGRRGTAPAPATARRAAARSGVAPGPPRRRRIGAGSGRRRRRRTGSSSGSPDGAVRVVDLRLEQLAPEQVVHDERRHGALAHATVRRRPQAHRSGRRSRSTTTP